MFYSLFKQMTFDRGKQFTMCRTKFPLFIVAGMPRGGTTFLYHNLNKHPSIFLPFRKEVNFFNVRYDSGAEWYNDLYKEREQNQICGDISPPYFIDVGSLQRIKEYAPEAKLILSVRDPVEWAISFYLQFHSFSYTMPAFKNFLDGYEFTVGPKSQMLKFKDDIIIDTLELFMQKFGKQLLLFDFSYLKHDSLAVLRAIENFLEIPSFFEKGNYDDKKINASDRKNIKLISNVLQQEWLISLIQKYIPRKMTLFLRRQFDRLSASSKAVSTSSKRPFGADDINNAQYELSSQCERIKKLFEKSPLILGDTTPYYFR